MNENEGIETDSESTQGKAEELSDFYERQARRYGKNLADKEEEA